MRCGIKYPATNKVFRQKSANYGVILCCSNEFDQARARRKLRVHCCPLRDTIVVVNDCSTDHREPIMSHLVLELQGEAVKPFFLTLHVDP